MGTGVGTDLRRSDDSVAGVFRKLRFFHRFKRHFEEVVKLDISCHDDFLWGYRNWFCVYICNANLRRDKIQALAEQNSA